MQRQAAPGGIADPHRGRKIGKYEILTRLSVGGMAELFLAFTSGPGGFRKFVALKQILPDVKTDEFVRMFLDEARITAAFSHPNIGQVFDLGLEDGELYLAMEFLPGQNLEQVMIAASYVRPLPIGFSARVARDICLGLHYAHHFTAPSGKRVAVVHRDMAPRNVMITYDGVVKVIDFGIAKAKGRIARTHVGMVKGTSGYMSPEQVRGYELDGRSDLFTAGVLLHEMLSGLRLFDNRDEDLMMRQIANADVKPPRAANAVVPEALDAVVMRALAKDPARRFATGREMAKAIEAAVGPELFDEESVAELMQALFAEKRLQTLALLNHAGGDSERVTKIIERLRDVRIEEKPAAPPPEDDPSDVGPTSPAITLAAQQQPPRAPAPRLSGSSSSNSSPPSARPFPNAPRARAEGSPRKPLRRSEEDAPTQIGPPPGGAERSGAAEPREGRRSPKVGGFTLGPAAPQEAAGPRPHETEDELPEISRVSRVTQGGEGLKPSARRALWLILGMVVLGLAVLFMPEALRTRLGGLFTATDGKDSGATLPEPRPEPAPPPPGAGAGAAGLPQDVYEPPPPAESTASEKAGPPPAAPTVESSPPSSASPAGGARSRKPDASKARVPKSSRFAGKPPADAEPGMETPERAEPSMGPAEVDPSIQPLELDPPAPGGE